jgi:glycogen debranching enzyme
MTQTTLPELVTLVGGGTVVISTRDGVIGPQATGVFHADRRLLSRLQLTVADHTLALIGTAMPTADHWVAHHLVLDGAGRQRALLSRTRRVHGGVTEDVTVRAFGQPVTLDLRLNIAADLADLLRLRYGDVSPASPPLHVERDDLVTTDGGVGVRVTAPGATIAGDGSISWSVAAAPGVPGAVRLMVRPTPEPSPAAFQVPDLRVRGAHRWQRAVETSVADLWALRVDVAERHMAYIGAGAPWYMALFGRDSLLTAFQALLMGPEPALDALSALAAFQGTRTDETTGEEPGKILHELRTGHSGIFGLRPWQPYFGSVDATPLFVVLLGEAYRWGADPARVATLLPAARAAIDWCTGNGTRHPHGHLTYESDAHALHNQGWKDSSDAMVHADGGPAEGPIALVEVQGYHWRALRELAALERALGDAGAVTGLLERADHVRRDVLADFWIADRKLLAMALDGAGASLAVASSNAGHCLWAGMPDAAVGGAIADALGAPAMNAGWGIRTLGAGERAYDPLSYHRGTVWPHDSALVIDGLARYGRTTVAGALIDGMLDAAEHTRWRLPELYGGYGSDEVPAPVPYPVACNPQAWSAATPLQLLRTLLRIDPDVPGGSVAIGPPLTDVTLHVEGIRLGPHRLDVSVDRGRIEAHVEPPLRVTVQPAGDAPTNGAS